MTPARATGGAPRRPARALKQLRELRRQGKTSGRDFRLILKALEEASRTPGPLAREVRRSPNLHVAFRLRGGAPLGCIEIRGGRAASHRNPEPTATPVVLAPSAAVQAAKGHPARVLTDAYMNGAAKVEGETSGFMTVIALLEGLAPLLGEK